MQCKNVFNFPTTSFISQPLDILSEVLTNNMSTLSPTLSFILSPPPSPPPFLSPFLSSFPSPLPSPSPPLSPHLSSSEQYKNTNLTKLQYIPSTTFKDNKNKLFINDLPLLPSINTRISPTDKKEYDISPKHHTCVAISTLKPNIDNNSVRDISDNTMVSTSKRESDNNNNSVIDISDNTKANTYNADIEKKQIFFSHTWRPDKLGRDNHERVKTLVKKIKCLGWSTWFDEEDMKYNIDVSMSDGIENCEAVIVCLTETYFKKVNETARNPRSRDNCLKEWTYSTTRNKLIIPIIMEPCLKDMSKWPSGIITMYFGNLLYIDASDDNLNSAIISLDRILKDNGLLTRHIPHTPPSTPPPCSGRGLFLQKRYMRALQKSVNSTSDDESSKDISIPRHSSMSSTSSEHSHNLSNDLNSTLTDDKNSPAFIENRLNLNKRTSFEDSNNNLRQTSKLYRKFKERVNLLTNFTYLQKNIIKSSNFDNRSTVRNSYNKDIRYSLNNFSSKKILGTKRKWKSSPDLRREVCL